MRKKVEAPDEPAIDINWTIDPTQALSDHMEKALKELEDAAAPKPKLCPHCGKDITRE